MGHLVNEYKYIVVLLFYHYLTFGQGCYFKYKLKQEQKHLLLLKGIYYTYWAHIIHSSNIISRNIHGIY